VFAAAAAAADLTARSDIREYSSSSRLKTFFSYQVGGLA